MILILLLEQTLSIEVAYYHVHTCPMVYIFGFVKHLKPVNCIVLNITIKDLYTDVGADIFQTRLNGGINVGGTFGEDHYQSLFDSRIFHQKTPNSLGTFSPLDILVQILNYSLFASYRGQTSSFQ